MESDFVIKFYMNEKMSIYGKLDPMPEHRTIFFKKNKWEHIAKVKMPNFTYPNQHIVIEISQITHNNSREHAIVQNSLGIKFNLDIESTVKTYSIVKKINR